MDNIWLSATNFAKYIVTITPNSPIYAYSKSEKGKPTITMLEGTFAAMPSLKTGTRILSIQWTGGKAPYQVKIAQDETILWQTETTEQLIKTKKINFQAGNTYQLVINASNYATKYDFEILENLPTEQQLQNESLSENMRRTLYATWLAKKNYIKWSFEAYQQISDIADNYGPARELRKELLYSK